MTREFNPTAKEYPMKSLLLLTASGPLLILTSHESLHDQKLLEELKHKGIGKFVAFEVSLSLAGERYGGHFQAVESNLYETDDLRVLETAGGSFSSFVSMNSVHPFFKNGRDLVCLAA